MEVRVFSAAPLWGDILSALNYSIRDILRVVLPILLATLSVNLMYAADRLVLARYSVDAMNAAAMSSYIVSLLTYPFISIAAIAEIYVGQYNGAKQYDKVVLPVWQMIYFSLLAEIPLTICAIFSEYLNWLPEFYKEDGIMYQKVVMYFSEFSVLFGAVGAFFIGRGKTTMLTVAIVLSNIVNLVLDIVLIFGVDGIVKPMGVAGAALATGIASLLQLVIVCVAFVSKKNREQYGTLKYRSFDKQLFMSCIKVGAPLTVGRILEISAWYIIYVLLSHVSRDLATINGIAGTMYAIFIFFAEGLNKGVATLSANLIGRGDLDGIKRLFRIFNIFVIIFAILLILPIECYLKEILHIMMLDTESIIPLYPAIKNVMRLEIVCISVESIMFVVSGILLSGGDSKKQIQINMSCLWIGMVIPACILYFTGNLCKVEQTYMLACVWAISSTVLLYYRYKSLKWYNKLV